MKEPRGGKIGTVARQAAQGLTFGFSDEMADAISGTISGAIDPNLSIVEAIKEARKLSKEDLALDWKNSPVLSFGSQVAGSLPLGLTKAAINAGNWVRGGTALSGVLKGAAVGAGYGGLLAWARVKTASLAVLVVVLGAQLSVGLLVVQLLPFFGWDHPLSLWTTTR
jgi:hypothetical protein